jgi:cystathionine beta-lyase family protein involved in aluminum resistance
VGHLEIADQWEPQGLGNERQDREKMTDRTEQIPLYIAERFGIDPRLLQTAKDAEGALARQFAQADSICEYNQYKVLDAFRKNRISEQNFNWRTGYGYDDTGREATEKVYAEIFEAEAALVRPLIVNGTHALSMTFLGILRPGDALVYCTGAPYDTLWPTIGLNESALGSGTLKDYGISYRQVALDADGGIDFDALKVAMTPETRMVALQRATGYAARKRALNTNDIRRWADFVHAQAPDVICMVDNCYGEFLDIAEPTALGADICAGSLIKNPGGGIAISGGYVAGRKDLVDLVAYRMTCPGIGSECGLTFGQTRSVLQGLFMAPKVVNGAVKGAMLCAAVFEKLGFAVSPAPDAERSDIIEAVSLGSPEGLIAFCEGVQAAAPIDSFVRPEPWDMPGYEDQVIMAAGAFVQGSSIELSADGPMRPPYNAYFQGGLTYEHAKIGVLMAAQRLLEEGHLTVRCPR